MFLVSGIDNESFYEGFSMISSRSATGVCHGLPPYRSITLSKTEFDEHLAELDEFRFFVKKSGFRRPWTVEL